MRLRCPGSVLLAAILGVGLPVTGCAGEAPTGSAPSGVQDSGGAQACQDGAVLAALRSQSARPMRSVCEFGAVGDGHHDDTQAIQAAFDAAGQDSTVVLPAGYTFTQSGVLTVATPGLRVTGGADLRADVEERSEFLIAADRVSVEDIHFSMARTTARWDRNEQMRVRISGADGVRLKRITILGSAAAGIMIGSAQDFELSDSVVMGTRADGIHMVNGAANGRVVDCTVKATGDDGVSVVSYDNAGDGPTAHDIVVSGTKVLDQRWGRAFSVVGGTDIRFENISSDHSAGAAVYLATENEFNSRTTERVTVSGGTLSSSNANSDINHTAVLVYNSREGTTLREVVIEDLDIVDTRADADADIALRAKDGGRISDVQLRRITARGGPNLVITASDGASYTATDITKNGDEWRG